MIKGSHCVDLILKWRTIKYKNGLKNHYSPLANIRNWFFNAVSRSNVAKLFIVGHNREPRVDKVPKNIINEHVQQKVDFFVSAQDLLGDFLFNKWFVGHLWNIFQTDSALHFWRRRPLPVRIDFDALERFPRIRPTLLLSLLDRLRHTLDTIFNGFRNLFEKRLKTWNLFRLLVAANRIRFPFALRPRLGDWTFMSGSNRTNDDFLSFRAATKRAN